MNLLKNGEVFWLRIAYYISVNSPDPSTQNGALIVDSANGVLCSDFNRPSAGVTTQKMPKILASNKYYYMEHAERAVILTAARQGIMTEGHTMVVPWGSCHDCARAIVHSGIAKVIRHRDAMIRTPDRWKDSTKAGDAILRAAGVKVVEFAGKVDGPSVRLDNQYWIP